MISVLSGTQRLLRGCPDSNMRLSKATRTSVHKITQSRPMPLSSVTLRGMARRLDHLLALGERDANERSPI
eukprot:2660897-Heterocapsa_arctica.AAC.1